MPRAICEDCNDVLNYRGTRGFRLKDVKCKCGGRYRKAKYSHRDEDTGKPVYVPMEYTGQSGKMINCALCGKRRRMGQSRIRVLEQPKEFNVITYTRTSGVLDKRGKKSVVTVKPGESVCEYHFHDPDYPVIKHVEA